MLKIRMIPTLLVKETGLVKGVGFDSWRYVDTVLPMIKVYNMREVDELILVDIEATRKNQEPDYDSIKEYAKECFVPFCVGGGIHSKDQVRELLRSGADKVSINSAAYGNPDFITDISATFGTQCVVASIDYRSDAGKQICYSHSGEVCEGVDVVEWARIVESKGAGEILLTSIERDGTMEGYDLETIKKVTSAVRIPVIASGGAGNYDHMCEAVIRGGASAVAAASIFHFTEQTPKEAKQYMHDKGIDTRLI